MRLYSYIFDSQTPINAKGYPPFLPAQPRTQDTRGARRFLYFPAKFKFYKAVKRAFIFKAIVNKRKIKSMIFYMFIIFKNFISYSAIVRMANTLKYLHWIQPQGYLKSHTVWSTRAPSTGVF